jgi:plasmid stabilization system protein ParE
MARIRREDEADAGFREAGRWYQIRRAGVGAELFDAVEATLRRIVEFPRAGAPVPRVSRDLPVGRLAVERFPSHVVYLDTPDTLRVLAVAHDRRKPGYWKHRIR